MLLILGVILLAQVDAQGHVVALVDHANGTVVERYLYDPDGRLTVINAAGVLQPPGTESAYHWRVLWNQAWHDGGGRYLQRSGMLWDATLGSTLTYNPVLALVDKLPAPELGLWDTVVYAWQQAADVFWEDPALAGHLALDAVGLIPGLGVIADSVNAVWYGFEGDWFNAGLSAGAAIPGAGYAFNAVKYGSKTTRLYKASRAADVGFNLGASGYFVGHGLASGNYVEAGLGALGLGVNGAVASRALAQSPLARGLAADAGAYAAGAARGFHRSANDPRFVFTGMNLGNISPHIAAAHKAGAQARSWSTARRRIWKAVADDAQNNPQSVFARHFSTVNLRRMQKGNAPQVRAIVHTRMGQRTRNISMTIHHRFLTQRSGARNPHQLSNLETALPWAHEGLDPHYFTGYRLEQILQGTSSFTGR